MAGCASIRKFLRDSSHGRRYHFDLFQTRRLGPMPIDRGTEERLTVQTRQQREGVAGLAEVIIVRAYFLPAFFAAQNAFNLADNLALAAGLMVFFLAVTARLTERGADLLP
jgi:hypothetical protein